MSFTEAERRRFWSRVAQTDGCWEWTGALLKGYGHLTFRGATAKAHRLAYEMSVGAIPAGAMLLHSCDNRACVNPAHLRPGAARDNADDAVARSTIRHGETHPRAKLTAAQVIRIQERWVVGERPGMLAAEFGVAPSAISNILSGVNWRRARYVAA